MATCSRCPAPAVTFLRYSGSHLCREHFLRFFDKRAKAELARQGRLPKGRVAVALSGGKDSVAVLHFLHGLATSRPVVELVAISVDEGIAGYREGSLEICRELTQRLGVDWHVVRTRDLAGYTIDEYARGEKGPDAHGRARPACGPCGVYRRMGLNQAARDVGAAAIATGHNLDDTAQTILMNHLNGDVERLARLAPHDKVQAGMVPRLIPFRTIPEKEVLLYALLNDLPIHDEAECPYAARAQRFFLRDTLLAIEERSPGTRHTLVKGLDKLKPLLADAFGAAGAGACSRCGEPASGELCKGCQWRA